MNNTMLSGNLSADPWIAPSGKKMVLKLAVSKNMSSEAEKKAKAAGERTADFFEVIVFNEERIKFLSKLEKGDGVIVECRLRNAAKQEAQTKEGVPMLILKDELIANRVEITNLRSKNNSSNSESVGYHEGNEYEEPDPIQYSSSSGSSLVADDDEW